MKTKTQKIVMTSLLAAGFRFSGCRCFFRICYYAPAALVIKGLMVLIAYFEI